QQLEGITGGNGDLHRLSRVSISAVEQFADCSNPGSLALRSQRQACQLGNNRRTMLTRKFLHLADKFCAPTRHATLALTKFQFSSLCYWAVLRQHYSTTQLASPLLDVGALSNRDLLDSGKQLARNRPTSPARS